VNSPSLSVADAGDRNPLQTLPTAEPRTMQAYLIRRSVAAVCLPRTLAIIVYNYYKEINSEINVCSIVFSALLRGRS